MKFSAIKNIIVRIVYTLILFLSGVLCISGQQAVVASEMGTNFSNTDKLNLIFAIIAASLLLAIAFLSSTFQTIYKLYLSKLNGNKKNALSIILAIGLPNISTLNATTTTSTPYLIESFDSVSWMLVGIIGLEIIVLILFAYWAKNLLKQLIPNKQAKVTSAEISWWDKINQLRPLEQESTIDTGHNYDGIRELDNVIPNWFSLSFIATIVFSVVYMWWYHISDYGITPHEEYKKEMTRAKIEIEKHLANQANEIDESNIPKLDEAGIAGGKKLYDQYCAVCHLADGGGQVGPNLTDKYWIHGGSLSDIYKVIKYGVPEKGMKSWQEDFPPSQIVQLANYIKSMAGTKPAVNKEPQGVLYEDPEDKK